MHSWKNGVRAGQRWSHECGETEEEADTGRGGEGCSNVEKGCGGRERAERVNGGKEREVQKGRGRSCAGRVKERERERKDRRGELPATRSPSIYLAKTADTCLRRYTRVVL